MNNKLLLIIVILVVIIGAALGFFYFSGEKPNKEENPQNQQEEVGEDKTLELDEFSVLVPAGWRELSTPPEGITALVVKENEALNDPVAEEIKFQSYYSISFAPLGQKTESEYLEYTKEVLKSMLGGEIDFTREDEITINGKTAYVLELEANQEGVDFTVLVGLIMDGDGGVWGMSLNTTTAKWPEYKDAFEEVLQSFTVK